MLRHLAKPIPHVRTRLNSLPHTRSQSTSFPPQLSRSRLYTRWSRSLLIGTSASALAYYTTTQSTIHADVVEISGVTKQTTPWLSEPPPSTDYLLNWNSMAEVPPGETDVARIESVIIASNSPSEDFISVALADQATVFGVFDGHNGPATSGLLSLSLPTAVLQALDHLFSSTTTTSSDSPDSDPSDSSDHSEHAELGSTPAPTRPTDASIDAAIKSAFLAVDHTIVNDALREALAHPTPRSAATVPILAAAQAGSCALLGIYEHETRQLRVALTGDSRAVLGRRAPNTTYPSDNKASQNGKAGGKYEVHVLSQDQNGHNPTEVARITAAHPNETILEKGGRVLGWGMSRAFGDALTKWSLPDQERVRTECLGDRPYSNVKTPPYFTAEPEITTTQVQKGDFLILASDGLWECLTSEEAVGLVGLWLSTNRVSRERKAQLEYDPTDKRVVKPGAKAIERAELPVVLGEEDGTVRYKQWKTEKKFLNVDENVAVHLARNALGGADRELTGALLALTPPRARRFRDDISISVVFFD